jgi:hypothetical protein
MSTHARQQARRIHRRRVLSLGLTLVLAVSAGIGVDALGMAAEPKPVVSLVVDYGDGASLHFADLKWRSGMTVFDVLLAAKAHPHGITFTQRGSGRSTLVTKIADLANEGNGKNWLYYVNEKAGEESAAVHEIKAGDAVLWKFQVYDYNP